ncbi:MAG TPA: hypothetical protein PLN21_21835 [Gemmatales bacterium]|nr:hypothetical protein [Gemmatales bacterium]
MEKKYYSNFLITFLMLLSISVVAGFLSTLIINGELGRWEEWGYPILGIFVMCLVLTLIAIPLFPVIVWPEGLKTYNFWGGYVSVNWSDIVSTNSMNLLGLRYVTFRTTNNKTLYIPRFLTNFVGFRDQVAAWAGEHHLLTQALFAS